MVYLTCAIIGLGGQGVIKTWTKVAARVRLYVLTSDLTSLVPPQFSHWLQVRKVGTIYLISFYFIYSFFLNKKGLLSFLLLLTGTGFQTGHIAPLCPRYLNPHSYPNLFLTTRAERSAEIGNFQQYYMTSESVKRLLMIYNA